MRKERKGRREGGLNGHKNEEEVEDGENVKRKDGQRKNGKIVLEEGGGGKE